MIRFFGDKSRFAIEVGEFVDETGTSRRVDVWAADVLLTCDDKQVYVPAFVGCLQRELGGLLNDPSFRRLGRPYPDLSIVDNFRRLRFENENADFLAFRFMAWGPTADNVGMTLFREAGTAHIAFEFWRPDHQDPAALGRIFVADLPERKLALVLHEAAWCLVWDWANSKEKSRKPDN